MNVYDFKAVNGKGQEVSLSDYKGKVLLIVNTASKCGFTPQFEGLEKLYNAYKDRGFVVLGFPCNQFAEQDPGSDGEIQEFCRLNYGVTFPMFRKGDVRGDSAQPLFKYLTKEKGFKGLDMDHPMPKSFWISSKRTIPISWMMTPLSGTSPSSSSTEKETWWNASNRPRHRKPWLRKSKNCCNSH